jgi:hypothetical protein
VQKIVKRRMVGETSVYQFPVEWGFMSRDVLTLLFLASVMAFGAAKSEDGIVYCEAGGEKLTMDYYPPAGPAPHPIAIIHGGGFVGGTSKNNKEAYCADFLAPAGYAVFSINYRLAPKFPYPAKVEDVQRAIRYIRRNSKKWNADPKTDRAGGRIGGRLPEQHGRYCQRAGSQRRQGSGGSHQRPRASCGDTIRPERFPRTGALGGTKEAAGASNRTEGSGGGAGRSQAKAWLKPAPHLFWQLAPHL